MTSTAIQPARRPTTGRIVAGVAVGLLGILTGVGTLLFCIFSSIEKLPAPHAEFPAGETATVDLDRTGEWVIYGDRDDLAPSRNTCTVRTPEGTPVATTTHRVRVQTTRDGHDWARVVSFTTDAAGRYQISCSSDEGVTRFGVAPGTDVPAFTIWLVSGILGMLVLTAGGITAGVLIAVRRPAS